ncbi:futalosine hydrolase [Sphingobacterium siyangense]|jgi:futalosine hydrolase|uniref:Futalosine hydrolase n=2 Tax=Sphingobacterium TaxID=28453 RepID=A0ABX7CMU9_SPHMU|nr:MULTISPECIES: futalosine hydrolase [Sphingobacterium]QQT53352.1 futalosine hydrolase [Sphingobacterium multivorum]QRY58504.1 futalosine hydrolase [Sphingobacterium siyangense]RKF32315.1 futalosine hydrolase [Sphingobacterium siyangense]
MQILIIAATSFELQPFLEVVSNYDQCDTLVTGVGMVATGFELGRMLHEKKYDLLINVGIGGCLDRTIEIGSVIQVVSESFVELGAEDGHNFIPIDQLGYGRSTFTSSLLNDKELRLPFLKQGEGITVNKVHGSTESIEKIKKLHPNSLVESMEGAAVFYAADKMTIPVIEIRGISNYVERRNRATWNIPLAIMNSNKALIKTLEYLNNLYSKI